MRLNCVCVTDILSASMRIRTCSCVSLSAFRRARIRAPIAAATARSWSVYSSGTFWLRLGIALLQTQPSHTSESAPSYLGNLWYNHRQAHLFFPSYAKLVLF